MNIKRTVLRTTLLIGTVAGALSLSTAAHAASFTCLRSETKPAGGYVDPASGAWIDEFVTYCTLWSQLDAPPDASTPPSGGGGTGGLGGDGPTIDCKLLPTFKANLADKRQSLLADKAYSTAALATDSALVAQRAAAMSAPSARYQAALDAKEQATLAYAAAYAEAYGDLDTDTGAGKPSGTPVPVMSRIDQSLPAGRALVAAVAAERVAYDDLSTYVVPWVAAKADVAHDLKGIRLADAGLVTVTRQLTQTDAQLRSCP